MRLLSGSLPFRPVFPVPKLNLKSRSTNWVFGQLSGLVTGSVLLLTLSLPYANQFIGELNRNYPIAKTLEADADRKLILLTASGEPFAERGGCVEQPVRLAEVPQHLIQALLAIEDRRFYHHMGIDPIGLARAASMNKKAGRIVQGGSTITQQLAKTTYLSRAKNLKRKFQEALISLRLELNLSKEQILERYLNKVYFGDGCYGVRAAAKNYFEKDVGDLTLAESVYLVALLKSPTTLSADARKLRLREKLVLQAMVEEKYLDQATFERTEPAMPVPKQGDQFGAYYADWIESQVPREGGVAKAPLEVKTTLDPDLQKLAKSAVDQILDKYGERRKASEASLVAMTTDGRIVAMVGGRNYGQSQFNRATQAQRQPASAFKLFVYLAALRSGATLDMQLLDEPITINDWSPDNYNNRFRGWVSLQQAFSSSINSVAVSLSESVGRKEVIAAARDLGISTPLLDVPSLALGTSEVSLLELTAAYAAIPARAYPIKPWAVVQTGEGKKARARLPEGAGAWRLEADRDMRELLRSTVRQGTGRSARLAIPSYGKTGTSQDYRNAWFIGFAGNLVVGVWVGNDDNSSMNRVTGGNMPAMIWRKFMNKARRDKSVFKRRPDRVAQFERQRNPLYQFRFASVQSPMETLMAQNLELMELQKQKTVKSPQRAWKVNWDELITN